MLIRLNVNNFLSFDDNIEFSMIPGKVRGKEEHLIQSKDMALLRFAAIYGANASGKSNLIKALSFSQRIILEGVNFITPGKCFKLKKDNEKKESIFEYEIYVNKKYYAYGFKIILSERKITGEWLYEISKSGEKAIFERNVETGEFNHNTKFRDNLNKMRFKIYSEDYKTNGEVLLLSELNRNKEELYKENSEFSVFRDVYNWFGDYLDVNYPDESITNFEYLFSKDENSYSEIVKILNSFGTGITDFKLIDSTIQDIKREMPEVLFDKFIGDLRKVKRGYANIRTHNNFHNIRIEEDGNIIIKTLAFNHGDNYECNFYLSDESDGTRRLMDLIEVLINTKKKVFVIDELDRSLHPNLTYKFIETFLKVCEGREVQLIITTHEDRVLDLDMLRRDEVWFMEKNLKGASKLYSLEKYQPRFDKKICKAYLDGRYGAVPIFKSIDSKPIG